MKKLLVTGAGGYIGSIAVYQMLQKGYEVVGIDNFFRGNREPLIMLQKKYGKKRFRWYSADITRSLSPILKKEKNINAVLHFAALCDVNESMRKPTLYFKNNVNGMINVLDNMVKYDIPYIVFSSTCAVYEDSSFLPVGESHPVRPSNIYAESKHMAERLLHWYSKIHGIHFIIFRYFNVSGASRDGRIGDSKKPSGLLVQNAVRAALDIEPFLLTYRKVKTPDGSPVRDIIDVVDLIEAHEKALNYLKQKGNSTVINLGTGTGYSVLEILNQVNAYMNVELPLKKGSLRSGEAVQLVADSSRAQSLLGWKPKRLLSDTIASLSKWYKVHPNGWSY